MDSQGTTPDLRRATWFAATWAFAYAGYRWYYALGGTIGMPGVPASEEQWRLLNAIGGLLVWLAGLLPLVVRRAWPGSTARSILLGVSWVVEVACIEHALIDVIERILSLAGQLDIPYPFWQAINHRKADLQDLFFNEPWFLGEGLAWVNLAWAGGLKVSPRRRWWLGSAILAIVAATTFGVLVMLGVAGRVIIG